MNLSSFSDGSSPLHRRDPRVKVVVAACFAVVVALMQAIPSLLAGLALSLVWCVWGRLPAAMVLRRLLLVNGFVAMLWLFLPFTHPGPAVFVLGPLAASQDGLLYAAALTLRTNAIVLGTMALLGTTSVFNLVHALHHLRVPGKLAQVAFFSFRYVDVIQREYWRLRSAMRIRCFQPRTTLHTYVSYAYLVGMLLVRSFERSQRVYQAMLCRGYRGELPVYQHFALNQADLLFGGSMLIAILALGAL